MCGIAGIAGLADRRLVRKMCNAILHRGPNHGGYFIDKGISIGYRRLSIIDVSGGNQPIFNESGDIAIVYNGEIYNYKELKTELEGLGHVFETDSDTETIVHGYEEWGFNVLSRLRGMFAFAIYDSKKKRLFIARDPFGKKPLYYAVLGGVFAFASEIKALRVLPNFDKSFDYSAIDRFLALRFIPAPDTVYKKVKKLPGGHYLVLQEGKIKIQKYWALSYLPQDHSEAYFAKKVGRILEESVRMRLMSEVPLGAYLSGGLDSSSIVSLMARNTDLPVKTFSVGFGIAKYDELQYARAVSDEFSTDHHELLVKPESIKDLPRIVWHLDEPMADPTAIPNYLLSKYAKKYVTVVLTGEGGDEIFGGYEQYRIMQLAYKYGKLVPRIFRRHVVARMPKIVPRPVLDALFKYSSALGKKGIERFSTFISDLDNPARSYLDLVEIITNAEREQIYSSGELGATDLTPFAQKTIKSMASDTLMSQMQLFDIKTELAEDLLMKVDKTAMAFSIEARAPLLDRVLAELAFTIPSGMKLKGGVEKHILKKAMHPLLPRAIIARKKTRFFVPLDYWFGGDMRGIAQSLLIEGDRGLFDKAKIAKIIENYSHSKAYAARQLWSLMTLEIWMRLGEIDRPVGLDALLSEGHQRH
ncbi:MAG: asparagine synthase (glutamine-hydrolyzing) [Candidatus Micrarchaeota archaeon]